MVVATLRYADYVLTSQNGIDKYVLYILLKEFREHVMFNRIYVVCGKTYLWCGIDRLASIVQTQYELDIYEDALFLFRSTRSDQFKMLYWNGEVFLLFYKRLENGKLHWPRHQEEVSKLFLAAIECNFVAINKHLLNDMIYLWS